MKLALVTDAWLPQVNGVVTTLIELVRQLRALGHEVEVIEPGQFRTRPCPGYAGIDLAIATTDLLPVALDGVTFVAENIHLDPSIHAAEQANRLVIEEGIPFREAYRRVGAQLFGKK